MKLLVALLLSFALLTIIHAQDGLNPASPPIIALEAGIKAGRADAVTEFWSFVKKTGTPLVESIDGGDPGNSLVTFVWRGNAGTKNVLLQSPFFQWNMEKRRMSQVAGTDIWYKTAKMPNDTSVVYRFSVNDPRLAFADPAEWNRFQVPLLRDPLGRSQFTYAKDDDLPGDEEATVSTVELPLAVKSPYTVVNKDIKHGGITKTQFSSKILPDARRIWFYTPPGYSAAKKYPLVVFFDGWDYLNHIPAQTILDNLIAAGKIEPVVAAFVATPIPAGVREKEYYANPRFPEFVIDELLPLIQSKYSVASRPDKTTIVGLSASGVAGAYVALKHPDKIGNVIMQSPAVWWSPDFLMGYDDWLTAQYVDSAKVNVRFYVEVGKLESRPATSNGGPVPLYSVKHFRDVLKLKGNKVIYSEFNGAHDYLNWRESLPDALIKMLGTRD